jgi:sulfur relay (sulfurtransferase) complex TusBCD TusD component (DsrE family)
MSGSGSASGSRQRASNRRTALILTGGPVTEQTVTALQLAERLLLRGSRVTIFAHAGAAAVAAGGGELAAAVAALLRRGVHGATLDWVVDAAAAGRAGVDGCLVPGVVGGDHADLWAFVREADIVLSTGGSV